MKRRLDARTRKRCQTQRASRKFEAVAFVTCILDPPSPIRLPQTNLTSRVWNYVADLIRRSAFQRLYDASSMQSQVPTDDRHPRNKPVCRRKDYSESMLSKREKHIVCCAHSFRQPRAWNFLSQQRDQPQQQLALIFQRRFVNGGYRSILMNHMRPALSLKRHLPSVSKIFLRTMASSAKGHTDESNSRSRHSHVHNTAQATSSGVHHSTPSTTVSTAFLMDKQPVWMEHHITSLPTRPV